MRGEKRFDFRGSILPFERFLQRSHHPAWVGISHRKAIALICRARAQTDEPVVFGASGNFSQHRIHQAGRPRNTHSARQVYCLIHSRMCGSAHVEQLVTPELHDPRHLWLPRIWILARGFTKDGGQSARVTQGAVGEFGRKAFICFIERAVAKNLWPDEVRVGLIAPDCAQESPGYLPGISFSQIEPQGQRLATNPPPPSRSSPRASPSPTREPRRHSPQALCCWSTQPHRVRAARNSPPP